MLTMQVFHDRLFSTQKSRDPYLESLARLIQITPTQMAALKSDLGWVDWPAETA